jgi:hypothetical protein
VLHLNGRRVFLYQTAVDMRKSYDTLADLVRAALVYCAENHRSPSLLKFVPSPVEIRLTA